MDPFNVFFFAVLALVVGPLACRWFRYKSFSAAIFRAPIERTVGEIELSQSGSSSSVLRVHVLGSEPGGPRSIGLQVINKAALGASTSAFNLSIDQAQRLAQLLGQAAGR